MNIIECNILKYLFTEPYINQRILSKQTGYSLGIVNKSLKELITHEYLTDEIKLTEKAKKEIEEKSPRNAIILAAGFGMRMVPINNELSKGMIQINNETLIERIITQLQSVGIHEIYIVVGFMKEQYDYLIDKYGVILIYNKDYGRKNNIHSLKLVIDKLSNTYIIPCDIWCFSNPFCKYELYSWYMVSDLVTDESTVRVNRKMELVKVPYETGGNAMIGISYIHEKDSIEIRSKIKSLCEDKKHDKSFWEEALYNKDKMVINAKIAPSSDVYEINTFEQLRELDSDSNHLQSDIITLLSDILKVDGSDIINIQVLKKGMTNRSFIFTCKEKRYIMRIPGEGTNKLINREFEYNVYKAISTLNISDTVLYINPHTGYKLTEFIENSHNCNPFDFMEVEKCMSKLKQFHESDLYVDHTFDLFERIEFYEELWLEPNSIYRDYADTKKKIYQLKNYIDKQSRDLTLTHIDSVCDNFIFYENDHCEEICLIDWEYAGMQDPHIDIAMFAIYALYNKNQVDKLIDIYFKNQCKKEVRLKIYCYIACCGLLWSNWCEYKRQMGIEFGEYSIKQYRYAKEYYNYFTSEAEENGD